MNEGALATLDHDAAINDLANGVMLKQIAERYNCSKVAVYKQLRKHPDYQDAIALQAHAFVQDAMEQVRVCDNDTVNIARARVDAAFKYAKAHNKDYADKQQVELTAPAGPLLNIVLSAQSPAAPQQVIDVTPSVKSGCS